jgi:hypothetical protein
LSRVRSCRATRDVSSMSSPALLANVNIGFSWNNKFVIRFEACLFSTFQANAFGCFSPLGSSFF